MQNPWTCKHHIIEEDCSFGYEYGSISATHEAFELRCKYCDMPVTPEEAEQVEGVDGVVVIDDVVYRVGDPDEFEIVDGNGDGAPEAIYADYFEEKMNEKGEK